MPKADQPPTVASDELAPSHNIEAIKAAKARDEAVAARVLADEPEPEAPAELTDEQLLETMPAKLRAAVEAGEIDKEEVLAKVRDSIATGALEASAAPEPEPDPLDGPRAEWFAAVQAVLGPETPVVPCAHCEGRGFNPRKLLPDQHRERCPECGGEGHVETGSKVETQVELPCEGCNGNGWRRIVPPAEAPTFTPAGVPLAPPYVPPPAQPPAQPLVTATRVG